jgi:hypothetical protein
MLNADSVALDVGDNTRQAEMCKLHGSTPLFDCLLTQLD